MAQYAEPCYYGEGPEDEEIEIIIDIPVCESVFETLSTEASTETEFICESDDEAIKKE
jgi:hypothetical protein